MSAEPVHVEDPEDPEVILRDLPEQEGAEFLRQYHEAVDAAHDPAGYRRLRSLLHVWRQTVAATGGSAAGPAGLAMVRLGQELGTLAGDMLRLAVQRAEADGHTWQEIGEGLGISPRAASQRFGRPGRPAVGQHVPPVITDAADRAITVLADWFGERYEAVAATFDATLAERFPVAGLATARAHLAGTTGSYQRLGDHEPLVRQAGDYTVADVPLVFEAGLMKGRVAFDRAGRVAGLYVLPPATP